MKEHLCEDIPSYSDGEWRQEEIAEHILELGECQIGLPSIISPAFMMSPCKLFPQHLWAIANDLPQHLWALANY